MMCMVTPSVKFYQPEKKFVEIINDFVKRCMAEGLTPEDFVVLTGKTAETSWLSTESIYSDIEVKSTKENGKVLFTPIRKFKGLEAKAVLIVDASMSAL